MSDRRKGRKCLECNKVLRVDLECEDCSRTFRVSSFPSNMNCPLCKEPIGGMYVCRNCGGTYAREEVESALPCPVCDSPVLIDEERCPNCNADLMMKAQELAAKELAEQASKAKSKKKKGNKKTDPVAEESTPQDPVVAEEIIEKDPLAAEGSLDEDGKEEAEPIVAKVEKPRRGLKASMTLAMAVTLSFPAIVLLMEDPSMPTTADYLPYYLAPAAILIPIAFIVFWKAGR